MIVVFNSLELLKAAKNLSLKKIVALTCTSRSTGLATKGKNRDKNFSGRFAAYFRF